VLPHWVGTTSGQEAAVGVPTFWGAHKYFSLRVSNSVFTNRRGRRGRKIFCRVTTAAMLIQLLTVPVIMNSLVGMTVGSYVMRETPNELKATSPTIRYCITIYSNHRRYESSELRSRIIEAEASTFRERRQWRGIGWTRPRGS